MSITQAVPALHFRGAPIPDPTPTTVPPPAVTARNYSPVALAVLTGLLILLCLVLMYPFLPALAWGLALAVIAWPLQARVERLFQRRGLAAGVTTVLVTGLILVCGAFMAIQLGREASSAAERIKNEQPESTLRDKLAEVPALHPSLAWADRVGVDIDGEARTALRSLAKRASSLVQGSAESALQFVVAMVIVYFFLRDRQSLIDQARRFLPVNDAEYERLRTHVEDSIHANLYATLVCSLVYGITGGLLFWAVGVPSPVTWGVVMFFLGFLPIVGAWLVWVPAAAYLGLSGDWPEAAILVAWGVASGFAVSIFLYARLAGDRMRMHQVPALLAFMGGLAVFGAAGMVLGPAILALTKGILDVWHTRASGGVPA